MTIKSPVIVVLATVLTTGNAFASSDEYGYDQRYAQRGPVPFEVLDLNADGVVTQEEHARVHSERQAWRAEHNYPMRGAANAARFEQIDRDASGALDRDELNDWRAQRMQQRFGARMGPCVK
ncbi:MAG: hypothetical protein KDI82_02035 [Gammaproteobacteria bacterium]|nr:hypothetical protein [Gammaproteobacteria bacterium]